MSKQRDTLTPRLHRLKLTLSYDGKPFQGWQSQKNRSAVQDHLEAAFRRLSGERVAVHGAGRTDAGVHAVRQCAHVDVERGKLTPDAWLRALNGFLPSEIRVLAVRPVPTTFHARFSAKGKVYRYRIWNAPVLPPLELGRAWHRPRPLDLDKMRRAAVKFKGRHDFASFGANRGEPVDDTVRTIRSVRVASKSGLLTLTFEGNGFLYKMVRLMTGTLVRCGEGSATATDVARLLRSKGKERAVHSAPAKGLFLVKVIY